MDNTHCLQLSQGWRTGRGSVWGLLLEPHSSHFLVASCLSSSGDAKKHLDVRLASEELAPFCSNDKKKKKKKFLVAEIELWSLKNT